MANKYVGVKDWELWKTIRDLEHHVEDLLTSLRTKRKKYQELQVCTETKCIIIPRVEEKKLQSRESESRGSSTSNDLKIALIILAALALIIIFGKSHVVVS
ncbi:hypothetical protein DRO24_03515 [Candidatus Bathyarchaeota archaeon]|nr:MAG: hypothetical protein DRO24_03515 [Candidatus Bathyarchaeota archaeon]